MITVIEKENFEGRSGQSSLKVIHIYLKDLSFESPLAPEALQYNEDARVAMDIETNHQVIGNDLYQVVLTVSIKLLGDESQVLFLVEVQQAGIVKAEKFSNEGMRWVMGVAVPNILFPYIRETVDSITVKGGFAPLRLAPINFELLFQEAKEHEKDKKGAS